MTRVTILLFFSTLIAHGQTNWDFPNSGNLCIVKDILSKNSDTIRAVFDISDTISNFTFTQPNEYWLTNMQFPAENTVFQKTYFGTTNQNEIKDSILQINKQLVLYIDTLDLVNRSPGLNANCIDGEYCLLLKFSPIYNNVFLVNVYKRIEKKDSWSYDISKQMVQYIFLIGNYGDIIGWSQLKRTTANTK